MQITLNHDEIVNAIEQYVSNQGITVDGKKTEVNMIAGRGSNGFSATIAINAFSGNNNNNNAEPAHLSPENTTAKEDSPFEETEGENEALFGE